jgi:hypothetical protein
VALVRRLERTPPTRNQLHVETDSTYKIFEVGGETYLQINTFGSRARECRDHPSQTLQFDFHGLLKLRDILEREIFAKQGQAQSTWHAYRT